MIAPPAGRKTTLVLVACCLLQVAALYHDWAAFSRDGYLPIPFIYDKSDTLMDLFHPMYWADDDGRYGAWASVYPPLNFLLLKGIRWLLLGAFTASDAFALRDEARPLLPWIVLAYIVAVLFAFRSDLWKDFTGAQRALFAIACVLSPPVLFTIERGNLIILAPGLLALALARPGWARVVAIGLLINLKPYFALFLLAFVLTRRSGDLWTCTLMAGAIFLLSGLLLDRNFLDFLQNLLQFSQDNALFSAREVLSLPSSISAFTYVLRTYYAEGGNLSIIGGDITAISLLIEASKWFALLALFSALALANASIPGRVVLAAAMIAIANLGVWVGGYTLIFYIPLIPVLLGMTHWRIYATMVALILLPSDLLTLFTDNIGNQLSYLSNASVSVNWQLGAGSLLRPSLNFAMLLVMSHDIIIGYGPSLQRERLSRPWSKIKRWARLTAAHTGISQRIQGQQS